jgi:hypothetical protein
MWQIDRKKVQEWGGKRIYFKGDVIQVVPGTFSNTILVDRGSGGSKIVWVNCKEFSEPSVNWRYYVIVYGTVRGTREYSTVLGARNEVPEIDAKYIKIEFYR